MDSRGSPDVGAFTPAQYAAAYPQGIEHHWWMLARGRIVADVLRAAGAAAGPVLEVGCGRGAAVLVLRALRIACTGVELAPATPLPAARGLVVTGCDARELPETIRGAVRTILLLDVLEHLDAPDDFLGALEAGFPALRFVLVTVPARRELWTNYDEFYGHRRRYVLDELVALGQARGWSTRERAYAFRLLYPAAWATARLGLRRATTLAAPRGVASHAVHAAFARVMAAEARVLPRALPGSSALALFERGLQPESPVGRDERSFPGG